MTTTPLLIELPDELQGERVLVRPYGQEDAAALLEAIEESRAHLAPWLPWVHGHRSLDDSRTFIRRAQAHWLLREDLPVGIFDLATGRLLGGSGLHRIEWELRRFEIGYWLRATAQGHGYMQEVVRLLTSLAFNGLQANRVQIQIDPRNRRSQQVAERLGYTLEGTLRRCAPGEAGLLTDRHMYALIPEDYVRLNWARAR